MSILCLLSGCKRSSRSTIWKSVYHDQLECEARLVDVPIPLGIRLEEHVSHQENDISCTFVTLDTVDFVHTFYIQHMELEGWRLVREFLGDLSYQLLFEKPQKICFISLVPQQTHPQKTYVSLWTGPKVS